MTQRFDPAEDYGLFGDGFPNEPFGDPYLEVDGERDYGKDEGSRTFTNAQARSAYCQIRRWARSRGQREDYPTAVPRLAPCDNRPAGQPLPYTYRPLSRSSP